MRCTNSTVGKPSQNASGRVDGRYASYGTGHAPLFVIQFAGVINRHGMVRYDTSSSGATFNTCRPPSVSVKVLSCTDNTVNQFPGRRIPWEHSRRTNNSTLVGYKQELAAPNLSSMSKMNFVNFSTPTTLQMLWLELLSKVNARYTKVWILNDYNKIPSPEGRHAPLHSHAYVIGVMQAALHRCSGATQKINTSVACFHPLTPLVLPVTLPQKFERGKKIRGSVDNPYIHRETVKRSRLPSGFQPQPSHFSITY